MIKHQNILSLSLSDRLSASNTSKNKSDEKGSKIADGFEVWHRYIQIKNPLHLASILRFDQRR